MDISSLRYYHISTSNGEKILKKRIGLFITCLADNFYPRTGIATVKILESLGYEVAFPTTQTCCGQPLYNNGYFAGAHSLASKFVNEFAGTEKDNNSNNFDYVIMPSGSCTCMIREHYSELLLQAGKAGTEKSGKPKPSSITQQQIDFITQNTYEITEFLLKFHKDDLIKNAGLQQSVKCNSAAVTFHYSCHYRGLGIKLEEIEELIQLFTTDKAEYRRLPQAEFCCGFGGTFAVNFPTISGSMVEDKVNNILQSGAETVICNDSGCTLNITGAYNRINGNDRKQPNIRFISLPEFIAESLGLMKND